MSKHHGNNNGNQQNRNNNYQPNPTNPNVNKPVETSPINGQSSTGPNEPGGVQATNIKSVDAINKLMNQGSQQNNNPPPQQPPPQAQKVVAVEVAEDTPIVVDKDNGSDPLDEDEVTTSIDVEDIPEDAEIDVVTDDVPEPKDTGKTPVPLKLGNHAGSKKLKNISKITYDTTSKIETAPDYQTMVMEQFITNRSVDITGSKSMTRVVLPYSGFYFDLLSFSNGELQNIHRSTSDLPYLEKIVFELQAIYSHMKSNSFKPNITLEDWLMSIKLPDLWAIYWGVYNNYSPGKNIHKSRCDSCGINLSDERDNYEGITWVSEDSRDDISQNDIDRIIGGAKMEDVGSYRAGLKIVEKEDVLPDSRIKVYYGMPSLFETIVFLRYLTSKGENDIDELVKRLIYPTSHLRIARAFLPQADYIYTLFNKCILYVRKILAPVTETREPRPGEEPGIKLKATYVDVNTANIPAVLDNLSKKDSVELCKGAEMWRLIRKSGFRFTVRDSICPSCGTKQRNLELDMRDLVFTRAAHDLDFLAGI